jgi:hypothetical protein
VTEETKATTGTMPVKPDVEPQHVQVQHILIGFAGRSRRKTPPAPSTLGRASSRRART